MPEAASQIASIDERVRISVLANGVRVVSDPVPSAASVAVGCWVGAGSRDEPEHLAGASHFMEHLLFKGTEHRSAAAVNAAIDAVGGDLNAFTTKEHTAFYTRVPADALGLGLDLLGEILTVPALEERHVEIEREVILEELAMVSDSPDELVFSKLNEELFADHPLGWEVLGREASLEAVTPGDLRGFFDDWYRAPHVVVAAAGAVDHEWLVGRAEHWFDGRVTESRHDRTPPGALRAGASAVERDTEQVHLAIGWRGVDQRDPDRYAVAVLDHLLGDGPSSRLFRQIRDERGLAYSIFTGHSGVSDTGAMSLYCGTAPEHIDEVRELVDAELTAICTDRAPDEEVATAVGYLCGSLIIGLEDHGARMSRLASLLCSEHEVIPVADVIAGIRAVGPADVLRVANRLFGGPRVEVTIGPAG